MPTTVYFATNRVIRGPADDPNSYTTDIQKPSDASAITYGTAFVSGIDVATNNPGIVDSIQNISQGSFDADAYGDLASAGRNLLLFIHGFDNTFSDALTRGALNREWMAASGFPTADTTVLSFSWPSLGQIVSFPILQGDYLRDQSVARNSGIHLMSFFANLEPILKAARAAGQRTFLLAHSMGNLALESAVENWFLHGNGAATLFDLAILAAGDCPRNAFQPPNNTRLSGLPQLAARVTTFYSHVDQVLSLSSIVNLGTQRLGQDGPNDRANTALYPTPPFNMIDASGYTDYDVSFLNSHQYYRLSATARGVIAAAMGSV